MSSECQCVLEIWAAVRDVVPAGKRAEVATSILRACEEYGFDGRDLYDLLDEDHDLAAAFRDVFEDDLDETEDEED